MACVRGRAAAPCLAASLLPVPRCVCLCNTVGWVRLVPQCAAQPRPARACVMLGGMQCACSVLCASGSMWFGPCVRGLQGRATVVCLL